MESPRCCFKGDLSLSASVLRYLTDIRAEIRPWHWALLAMLYLSAVLPSLGIALWLLGFISFQVLKEYFSIIPLRRSERTLLLFGYATIPIQFYLVGVEDVAPALAFVPLFILILSGIGLRKEGMTPQMLNSTLKIGWGVFTLVYTFSFTGFLAPDNALWYMAEMKGSPLLYLLLLVHGQSLIAAVLARLGVNQLMAPTGHLLSVGATGLIAWSLGPWLLGLQAQDALVIGLLIGTTAYLGSMTIRAIQQALYLTEEERLLPGLGGLLTLIYPFVYAAPLFYFLLWLYL